MPDIFLSYSREDLQRASQISHALEAAGYDIWWDNDLTAGDRFRSTIQGKLHAAKYVIVLWSQHSVKSDWVQAESSFAHEKNKLIPVLLEPIELPLPFNELQSVDFQNWEGDIDELCFQRLLLSIRAIPQSPESDPQPIESVQNEAQPPQVISDSGWLKQHWGKATAVGGAFMLILALAGGYNDASQIWSTLLPPPQLTLKKTNEGIVYLDTGFKLNFQGPPKGYLSIWNQATENSEVMRWIPAEEKRHRTLSLNKTYQGEEDISVRPTQANTIDRYIMIWTPNDQKHLPKTRYANLNAFNQALKKLEKSSKPITESLEIQVFPPKQ